VGLRNVIREVLGRVNQVHGNHEPMMTFAGGSGDSAVSLPKIRDIIPVKGGANRRAGWLRTGSFGNC